MQFGDNLNEEADEEMDVSDNDEDYGGPRKKPRNDKDSEVGMLRVRISCKKTVKNCSVD